MTVQKIEISQKTIIFTILLLIGLWVLYQIRSTVIIFFISFLLMTAVNPLVKLATRIKIPVIVVMLVIYLALIGLLSTVVASLVPAVVQQTKGLTQALPGYISNMEHLLNTNIDPSVINSYFNTIPAGLLHFAAGAFSNILDIMMIFFISYYLVMERPHLHKYLLKFFHGGNEEARAEAMVVDIEKAVGGWVRGELVLMLIIGLMTYGGLMLLSVPYALPLGVLAGILEAVPNIGPIIAAVPATLMGFTVSPYTGIGALVLSILVQQLENNLIVPRVMQSATGLKPLIIILVLLVGYTIAGAQGAVLGIPLYLTVMTIYKHLYRIGGSNV